MRLTAKALPIVCQRAPTMFTLFSASGAVAAAQRNWFAGHVLTSAIAFRLESANRLSFEGT